jgi:hypothetical protein
MTVEFDDHEVRALATGLVYTERSRRELRSSLEKGALNIKKDAQRRIRGLAHARAYPNSITYDVHDGLRGPFAEIGPDKEKRQGALGNLLEYGSVNNPPHPHVRPAADREEPRFAKAVQELVERQLGDL